jgi:hypothetical protein
MCLILVMSAAQAAPPKPQDSTTMLDKTYDLLLSGDSFQAIDLIERPDDPLEVIGIYDGLVRELYSKKKDVPRMLLIGRAGVRYGLSQAAAIEKDDAVLAAKLKGAAKTISFNLSANAWPGWEDEGIEITASDLVAGMDFARLNLRLAKELKRDDHVFANAHWLVGAHHLAAGQQQQAIEQFTASVRRAIAANNEATQQMSAGYVGIANRLRKSTCEEGDKQLAAAIAALKKIDNDDAKFFAGQLESVGKLFDKTR